MTTYKIYSITDGYKYYIGVTGQALDVRWRQHKSSHSKSLISKALKTKGVNTFTISIVYECESRDEAADKEREFIDYFNAMIPNGYNVGISKYPTTAFERKLGGGYFSYINPQHYEHNLAKKRVCLARIFYYDNTKRSFLRKFSSKRGGVMFIRELMESYPQIMRGEVLEGKEIIHISDRPKQHQFPLGIPPRRDLAWRTLQEMHETNRMYFEENKEYTKSRAQN